MHRGRGLLSEPIVEKLEAAHWSIRRLLRSENAVMRILGTVVAAALASAAVVAQPPAAMISPKVMTV